MEQRHGSAVLSPTLSYTGNDRTWVLETRTGVKQFVNHDSKRS
jgi:hypothetical protein